MHGLCRVPLCRGHNGTLWYSWATSQVVTSSRGVSQSAGFLGKPCPGFRCRKGLPVTMYKKQTWPVRVVLLVVMYNTVTDRLN